MVGKQEHSLFPVFCVGKNCAICAQDFILQQCPVHQVPQKRKATTFLLSCPTGYRAILAKNMLSK